MGTSGKTLDQVKKEIKAKEMNTAPAKVEEPKGVTPNLPPANTPKKEEPKAPAAEKKPVAPAKPKLSLIEQAIGTNDGGQILKDKHGNIQLWQGKIGWGVQAITDKNRYQVLLRCTADETSARTSFKVHSDAYDARVEAAAKAAAPAPEAPKTPEVVVPPVEAPKTEAPAS